MFLEFGEENKLALKFNFTYKERISTQKSDYLKWIVIFILAIQKYFKCSQLIMGFLGLTLPYF
jgi:hypothetical protein